MCFGGGSTPPPQQAPAPPPPPPMEAPAAPQFNETSPEDATANAARRGKSTFRVDLQTGETRSEAYSSTNSDMWPNVNTSGSGLGIPR